MNKFKYEEYESTTLRQRILKYVPINDINTTFMYGYTGAHDPVKQAWCEKQIDQDILDAKGKNETK